MCVSGLDGVTGVRQGDGGLPRLHCASNLWPFVTLSEWEERVRVRGL